MRKFYFLLLLILSSCAQKVDLIVHNAEVYVADLNFNKSSAFAINDGFFVEVGEEEILEKYSSNNIIDAQGLPVYPGFILKIRLIYLILKVLKMLLKGLKNLILR